MKSLNHIYRTIWSEALSAWVDASELASAKGKRSGSSVLNAVLNAVQGAGDVNMNVRQPTKAVCK